MVWATSATTTATTRNKRVEEKVLERELGLGITKVEVQVHAMPSNRLKPWSKRNDEVIGEGELDLEELRMHFQQLIVNYAPDTERRKACLETAREYAGMTDFKSARRYLEKNYLGPNPWTTEEDKKLLADIQRRREEASINVGSKEDRDVLLSKVEDKIQNASNNRQAPQRATVTNQPTRSTRDVNRTNVKDNTPNGGISNDASQRNPEFKKTAYSDSDKKDDGCCFCCCKILQCFC